MNKEANEIRKRKRIHPNSLKNLKPPIKPGEVLNPTGKNQYDYAAQMAREIIEENYSKAKQAYQKLYVSGDINCFEKLANRGYGKAPETVKLNGSVIVDGGERLAALLSAAAQRAGKAS